ncbi:MAG: peptide chain release factor N(5)-glutamine methyltransferase, partial [Elusimicrobiota bacterium]|nr:peptide chain release factor N(5)-glutamine methyltransferase [Elusimicrobiota bacterium]
MNKIFQALQTANEILSKNGILEPKLDAQVLLSYTLRCSRLELYLRYFDNLNSKHQQEFFRKINLRANHIPLSYLTCKKEFMGLEFVITPSVFIPRQETEILVEETVKLINEKFDRSCCINILDFGTGSGNISISIAKFLKDCYQKLKIFAVDISKEALEIAKKNAKLNNVSDRIFFIKKDLSQPLTTYNLGTPDQSFTGVPRWVVRGTYEVGRYDLIVSNPPYISSKEVQQLQKEILYEPREAIDGGPDGLKFYRIISEISKTILKKSGYVILEIGYNQLQEVKRIFFNCGFII